MNSISPEEAEDMGWTDRFEMDAKDAFSGAWREYAADFNALTDAEIEQEIRIELQKLEEAESWLEAVASWEAAGRPRSIQTKSPT